MATRTLSVQITGDSRSLDRALGNAGKSTSKFGGALDELKRAGPAALALVGVAAVSLGKKFVDAASDIDESLTKNQQLFGKHAAGVDKWSRSTANSLGISRREALEASGQFGSLFETIGLADRPAAQMSQRFVKLAADLASFNNASPKDTLEALRSGLAGEAEPMRKFGALLSENRVKQEAWRSGIAKTGHELTEQQKVQARYQLILKDTAVAQGDFGRTSGGLANSQRRLRAQLDDIGASIGKKLLPVVRDAANWFNRFLKQMQEGRGTGGDFRRAMEVVGRAVASAAKGVAESFRDIRTAIRSTRTAINDLSSFTSRVIRGDWRGTWREAARITKGDGIEAILRVLKTAQNPIGFVTERLGRSIVNGIGRGLSSLGESIKKKVVAEVKKGLTGALPLLTNPIGTLGNKLLKGIGDGVGKAAGDGLGFMGGSAGGSGAGLMGADMDLAPFARIGASMGLQTSSGLRPGSVTSSGNTSFHSSGDAIDMAGPPAAMMRFFKTMRGMFGSKLRELIYTPGGVGINDGRPFQYSGQVAADHYDHVHVAYTGPFGDGIGDMRNLWTRAGGRASAADMAAAIAMAESGGRRHPPDNVNTDGSVDRGPWQINSVHGALSTHDPLGNARAAVRISGNGSDWAPWVTFGSGAYRQFLGSGGSGGGGGGGGARRTPGQTAKQRFAQSQANVLARRRAAQRNAANAAPGKYVMGPNGIPVLRGAGSGPAKGGDFVSLAGDSDPALEENNRLLEQHNALLAETAANQTALLKLAGQGDQIVAAVVAAVNGGIGGRVGLGLQSPGFAGGVARY